MKIDLNSGAYLQISGELGKYNSLPIDSLVKIAQEFQNLIFTIAKIDLPSDNAIDLNNFKIELTGFKKGSAVPQFAYSSRAENKSGINWSIYRSDVNTKVEKILEIANIGDYSKIVDLYPVPAVRNPIVENLYSFTNSFGNSPAHFVNIDSKNKIVPIFKIHKLKSKVRDSLLGEIKEPLTTPLISEGVGKIKKSKTVGGKSRSTIVTFYPDKDFSIEYAPEVIVFESLKYILRYPLRCQFKKEEDYYFIQSEILGIVGTGRTEKDAMLSFAEEFNFVYNNLNSLNNNELTENNIFIKNNINHIVLKIEK